MVQRNPLKQLLGKSYKMKALPPAEQAALFKRIGVIRHNGKQTNYSATYGAGAATIARSAGVSKEAGTKLHEAYWKVNWAIPVIAGAQLSKTCNGQRWLYNPVSKLWYSLRHEKDIWSTLNQGTGVYCFDTWVRHMRSKRKQLTGQMHDEVILTIKKGNRDKAKALLRWAIEETNKELNLNIQLDIDIQFGDTYAAIH